MSQLSLSKKLLLSLGVYLVFLVANLPASQVIPRLDLPNHISISGLSGTIWQGKAQQLVVQGLPINNLQWEMNLWAFFTGKLGLELKAGSIRQSDEIAIRGYLATNGYRLVSDDLTLYLPTDMVIARLPLPIPVKAKGRFKVALNELDFEQQCQSLNGKGQWLKGAVAGTGGWIELGNFDANLGCENNNIIVDVQEPNSFGLSAKASIPANFKFQVTGKFKPDASLPQEVHQAARFFGQADASGYYQIRF